MAGSVSAAPHRLKRASFNETSGPHQRTATSATSARTMASLSARPSQHKPGRAQARAIGRRLLFGTANTPAARNRADLLSLGHQLQRGIASAIPDRRHHGAVAAVAIAQLEARRRSYWSRPERRDFSRIRRCSASCSMMGQVGWASTSVKRLFAEGGDVASSAAISSRICASMLWRAAAWASLDRIFCASNQCENRNRGSLPSQAFTSSRLR
jgi:hypothetical protein